VVSWLANSAILHSYEYANETDGLQEDVDRFMATMKKAGFDHYEDLYARSRKIAD